MLLVRRAAVVAVMALALLTASDFAAARDLEGPKRELTQLDSETPHLHACNQIFFQQYSALACANKGAELRTPACLHASTVLFTASKQAVLFAYVFM